MRKLGGVVALVLALILFGTAISDWKELVRVVAGAAFLIIGLTLLVGSTTTKVEDGEERTFFPHNV